MNRCEIEAYIENQYGVKAEYPFEMDDETAVFRQKSNGKWFAIIMRISKRRLHIDSDEEIDVMNVKCDPILIGSLLLDTGFYPAYHMNKTHWITVSPDADEDKVKMLIDMSFSLTALKRKKAIK
ncbi:MAG: MmcQ/YjbR family DNA-binding protein [Clostridia bacterium]|nr:MmcQ/YjbR family DNA-binding protein [Clostridiales bacterium]MBQ6715586.1 MmcQ/YjbR family DNA-binding protein [Clostridia bacterium]